MDLGQPGAARPSDRGRTGREMCPPTPAELRSLLDFVADRDPLLHVFLLAAAVTGARRAQLLGLRWHNIDIERARISFCRGWVEGPDGPVLTLTKTKRPHSVDVNPATFARLAELPRRCPFAVATQRQHLV